MQCLKTGALPGDPEPTQAKFKAKIRADPFSLQAAPGVEPSDVSDSILFLLSDEGRHITGSAIDVAAASMTGNVA